jgi:hypothetical protein
MAPKWDAMRIRRNMIIYYGNFGKPRFRSAPVGTPLKNTNRPQTPVAADALGACFGGLSYETRGEH